MMICFGKHPPPDSQTSARTQPGHYVNAKGSLMPGKFECEIPDICGSVPGAVLSEADKSAEGKGITSSSVFAQKLFSVKGVKQDASRFIHTPTPLQLRGVEAEFGKMEQSLHKSQVITGEKKKEKKKKKQLYNLRRGKVDSLLMEKPSRTLPPLDMVSAGSFYSKSVPACLPTVGSHRHHVF